MKSFRRGLAAVSLLVGTAAVAPAEVVVLKGGTVIELKQRWTKRGNVAYLTRADGTLLSVPVSDIDREATSAANQAPASAPAEEALPASTPAEVVRAQRDAPKARVKITDADVAHPLELPEPAGAGEAQKAEVSGGPRVEVADYTQEMTGNGLVVKGQLRNPGQGTAQSVRLQVSVLDESGLAIGASTAGLSKGSIESGGTVSFGATIAVPADRFIASLRFAPQWTGPPPAAPASGAGGAAAGASGSAGGEKPPAPRPTPYGRYTLWAAPPASAATEAPKDGQGYVPGIAAPDQQPKLPQ